MFEIWILNLGSVWNLNPESVTPLFQGPFLGLFPIWLSILTVENCVDCWEFRDCRDMLLTTALAMMHFELYYFLIYLQGVHIVWTLLSQ